MGMLWNVIKMPIKPWRSIVLRTEGRKDQITMASDSVDGSPGKTWGLYRSAAYGQEHDRFIVLLLAFLGKSLS